MIPAPVYLVGEMGVLAYLSSPIQCPKCRRMAMVLVNRGGSTRGCISCEGEGR